MSDDPKSNPMRFAMVGFELVGVMGVLMYAGYLFDEWQQTDPYGILIGAIVGITGGLYKLILDVNRMNK